MAINLKGNTSKGNTYNVGIFNTSNQNNLEINNTNNYDIKGGIFNCVKTLIDSKTTPIIGEAIYNREKYLYEVRMRLKNIPNEYVVAPRKSIVGPMCELFKYSDEEEYVRNFFANILSAECDNRTQKKVLPSFKTIVEQLSKEDADFLTFLKKHQFSLLTIIKIKWGKKERYQEVSFHILINNGKQNYSLIPYNRLVIDNLERLKIIEINSQTFYVDNKDLCKKAFEELKANSKCKDNQLFYTTATLDITNYGKNFIDICCS